MRRSEPRGIGWLLVGILCGSLVAGRLESGLLLMALASAIAAWARAEWPPRRWTVVLAISVSLGWLLNLYLTPGVPLPGGIAIAGRPPTREGLGLGALLGARLVGGMIALQGLRAVWPGDQAVDALAGALRPFERVGLPVRDARTVVGLAVRFAPLVESEGRRIAAVQALRAGAPARGWSAWLARRRAAAVPTMVSALERAERVALALEARHYRLRPAPRAETAARASWPWGIAGGVVVVAALLWR